MVRKTHVLTAESMGWQETTALVGKLNRLPRGWANYFQVGSVRNDTKLRRLFLCRAEFIRPVAVGGFHIVVISGMIDGIATCLVE
ncbi:MAG: hypothetical protein ACN4GR_10330 [Arenicellales bacterium]